MEYKNIIKLMDKFSDSNVHSLEIEQEDCKIKLTKENKEVDIKEPIYNSIPQQVSQESKQVINESAVEKSPQAEEDNFKIIKSPIVGTFYEASAPDAPPFVKKGDKVTKGQTLCIIEAMKLMNEIDSEYDGVVVEVLVNNEQMVEYGQPLFKIK